MNALLQSLDGVVVIEHYAGREPSPLPVIHPLLESRLGVDSDQLGERGIAAGSLNEARGLGWVHDTDINTSFMDKSNGTFIPALHVLFSVVVMEQPTPIQILLSWEPGTKPADIARKLDISPQSFNNWKQRGIPSYEIPRVAELYNKPIEVLLGASPDDDPLRDQLLAIWKVLIPDSKIAVLGHAKVIRTIQNPVGETGPHRILSVEKPPLPSES